MNPRKACEMLIVINGTIGAGKTSISKCLASEIEQAVWIEGDSLGFASPKNDNVLSAGIDLIAMHRKNGIQVIVFDMFFDDAKKLDWFISQVGLESHVFYLAAAEDTISNRIRQRARERAQSEILDSKRLRQRQIGMENRGIEIDTNGRSAEEITAEIKKLLLAKAPWIS